MSSSAIRMSRKRSRDGDEIKRLQTALERKEEENADLNSRLVSALSTAVEQLNISNGYAATLVAESYNRQAILAENTSLKRENARVAALLKDSERRLTDIGRLAISRESRSDISSVNRPPPPPPQQPLPSRQPSPPPPQPLASQQPSSPPPPPPAAPDITAPTNDDAAADWRSFMIELPALPAAPENAVPESNGAARDPFEDEWRHALDTDFQVFR